MSRKSPGSYDGKRIGTPMHLEAAPRREPKGSPVDAPVHSVSCPSCGAKPGAACRRPKFKGRTRVGWIDLAKPHAKRKARWSAKQRRLAERGRGIGAVRYEATANGRVRMTRRYGA